MMNKNKNLISLFTGLILLPIWAVGLLHPNLSDNITTFSTFLFSGAIILFLQLRTTLQKFLILIGPSIYFLSTIFMVDVSLWLTFPIIWSYLLIIIILFVLKKKSHQIILIIITSLYYSFQLREVDLYFTKEQEFSKFTENNKSLKPEINIFNYKFINKNLDTIQIKRNGKPFLVETWNESCKPCIVSINEMQDTLSKAKNFNHYYLYQNSEVIKSYNKILSFDKIKNKNKILIDINNEIYNDLGVNSYPYFLIVDSNGFIINQFSGYKSEFKNEILNLIYSSFNDEK